jgi:hypothetical protein
MTFIRMEVFGMLLIVFLFAFVLGWAFPFKAKQYPIEVKCHWETNGAASYPTMECDSINGDTLYKDGLSIVPKNIISISFN